MAFDFNKVKENIINVGKDVSVFAKTTSDTAKLKYEIHVKESFLEKQYALLGKAYYEAHKDEDVAEKESFASIKEVKEQIARLNEELFKIQGAVVCPNCGTRQEDTHIFCANCGSPLAEEAETEAEAVVEVEVEVMDADNADLLEEDEILEDAVVEAVEETVEGLFEEVVDEGKKPC